MIHSFWSVEGCPCPLPQVWHPTQYWMSNTTWLSCSKFAHLALPMQACWHGCTRASALARPRRLARSRSNRLQKRSQPAIRATAQGRPAAKATDPQEQQRREVNPARGPMRTAPWRAISTPALSRSQWTPAPWRRCWQRCARKLRRRWRASRLRRRRRRRQVRLGCQGCGNASIPQLFGHVHIRTWAFSCYYLPL